MSIQWPKAGTNDVGTYLISGVPFVFSGTANSGAVKIAFPTVTNWFSVKNTASGSSSQLAVAFTENGLNDNPAGINRRFFLTDGESRDLPFRVREIWLSGSTGTPTYDVVAGLTHVLAGDFPVITGSIVSGTNLVPPIFQGVG